jgi:hypothetical protein
MFARSGLARLFALVVELVKREAIYRWCYAITAMLIVAIILATFVRNPGINGYRRAMFGDMIYGRAHKPFVYRVLLPGTVRIITAAIPIETRRAIIHAMGEKPIVQKVFSKLKWEPEYLIEYGIASTLMYLSLAGFVVAIRYFFTAVFRSPSKFVDLVSLLALLGLPPFFQYYSYLYDFPTLFLFTLGLGLMVRRKWRIYLCVFFLACLNKETMILLTLIFVVNFFYDREMSKSLFTRLIIIQLAIFASVKLGLFLIFRGNPGTFVEFHLLDHNLRLLSTPYALSTAMAWLVLALLIFYKWQYKPSFLKCAAWIIAPLLLLTLFLGYLDELRDYYEFYPIALLLLSHTVGDILNIKMENNANPCQINNPTT